MRPAVSVDWARFAEYSPGDPGQCRRDSSNYPRYRYLLGGVRGLHTPRVPGTLLWIGVNPSTATHLWTDPTVRRIQRFTLDAGYGRYEIVNLFAFRSRDPEDLPPAADPVGPGNRDVIREAIHRADRVVCAWGAVPNAGIRARRAVELRALVRLLTARGAPPSVALGFTQSGAPRHPLYLPRRALMLAMRWDWIPEGWRAA